MQSILVIYSFFISRSSAARINEGIDSEFRRTSDGPVTKPVLIPLYQGFGTHYAYIYVGTPPQRQAVIIDTASSELAFPCKGCTDCGRHLNTYFDPGASRSAVPIICGDKQCKVNKDYGSGNSWKGLSFNDSVFFGGLSAGAVARAELLKSSVQFSCISSETGIFSKQLADGMSEMNFDHSFI
jgi:hypothetical protein